MKTFSVLLALCAGILRSPVNSPHKGKWRGALMFSLICTWINGWVNNPEACDLRRSCAHYDVTVMQVHHIKKKLYKAALLVVFRFIHFSKPEYSSGIIGFWLAIWFEWKCYFWRRWVQIDLYISLSPGVAHVNIVVLNFLSEQFQDTW